MGERHRRRNRHRLVIIICVASITVFFFIQLYSINWVESMTDYVMAMADATKRGRKASLLRFSQDMLQRQRFQRFERLTRARQEQQLQSATQDAAKMANSITGRNITGWRTNPPKFIKFDPVPSQGVGNILHGLLASHLLGLEFGRIVCVRESDMGSFLRAFEVVDPRAIKYCPLLWSELADHPKSQLSFYSMQLVNYLGAPNECTLKAALFSSTYDVISLEANTYPRWPTVPDNFFLRYYRPSQELLDMLPYSPHSKDVINNNHISFSRPEVVVHLRQGDSAMDLRKGLEEASLQALGEYLPRGPTTYLVTNKVAFYDYFETNFGWAHPNWQSVEHSILKGSTSDWGAPLAKNYYTNPQNYTHEELSMMQLYADWYTLLIAKNVYHTYSDFSLSAVHWMGQSIFSRTYNGVSDGDLLLSKENWIVDGESPGLIDRTGDELKLCDQVERTWDEKEDEEGVF